MNSSAFSLRRQGGSGGAAAGEGVPSARGRIARKSSGGGIAHVQRGVHEAAALTGHRCGNRCVEAEVVGVLAGPVRFVALAGNS